MLKITLISGQEQDVPFNSTSTVTVTNQGFVDGIATPVTASFSEIESLEIVPDPEPQVATIQTEDPPAPPVPTSASPDDSAPVGTEPTSGDQTVTVLADGTHVTGSGTSNPVDLSVTSTSNAFASPGNTSAGNDAQNPVVTQASTSSGLDAVVSSDVPVDPDAAADEPATPPEPDTSNPQVDELAATPTVATVDTVTTTPDTVGGALAAADAAGVTVTEPTDGSPVQDGSTQVDAEGNPTPADSTPPEPLATVVANAGAVVDAAVADPAAHVDHLAQAQTDVAQALATWPDDPNLLDLQAQLADLAADAAEAQSEADVVADEPPAAA